MNHAKHPYSHCWQSPDPHNPLSDLFPFVSQGVVNPSPMSQVDPSLILYFQWLLVVNHNSDGWMVYTNLRNFDQVQLKMAWSNIVQRTSFISYKMSWNILWGVYIKQTFFQAFQLKASTIFVPVVICVFSTGRRRIWLSMPYHPLPLPSQ
jgi:hypothetical protein